MPVSPQPPPRGRTLGLVLAHVNGRKLSEQPAAITLEELAAQLDRLRVHYNQHRPHRPDGTPGRRSSTPRSRPDPDQAPPVHFPVRYDTVDRNGKVTLRDDSRLHHIGLGARHRGKAIVLFVADRVVRIVDADGELTSSPMSRHITV